MPENSIPNPLPAQGYKVPVRVAFTGPKSAPLAAMSKNGIFPLLKLYDDGVEFRVFVRGKKNYADIERVQARRGFMTENIIFFWKDSPFTFTANVGGRECLTELLQFLQARGVPLDESARKILAAP